jgi:hypothetical protein
MLFGNVCVYVAMDIIAALYAFFLYISICLLYMGLVYKTQMSSPHTVSLSLSPLPTIQVDRLASARVCLLPIKDVYTSLPPSTHVYCPPPLSIHVV